jgi:hypothetical protein
MRTSCHCPWPGPTTAAATPPGPLAAVPSPCTGRPPARTEHATNKLTPEMSSWMWPRWRMATTGVWTLSPGRRRLAADAVGGRVEVDLYEQWAGLARLREVLARNAVPPVRPSVPGRSSRCETRMLTKRRRCGGRCRWPRSVRPLR